MESENTKATAALACVLVAPALASALGAQQGTPPGSYDEPDPRTRSYRGPGYQGSRYEPYQDSYRDPYADDRGDAAYTHGYYESVPPRDLEIAVSDESVWLAYRTPFYRAPGNFQLGFFGDSDDDFFGLARVMRYGAPAGGMPVDLGVGAGLYGVFLNEPDEQAYAITLCGSAAYHFDTTYPSLASAELSWAPDVTTFDEGDGLLDLLLRAEVGVSSFAAAFIGYRFTEVGIDRGGHRDVENRVHIGVRLGF